MRSRRGESHRNMAKDDKYQGLGKGNYDEEILIRGYKVQHKKGSFLRSVVQYVVIRVNKNL